MQKIADQKNKDEKNHIKEMKQLENLHDEKLKEHERNLENQKALNQRR